jgi:hypothetical protein
MLQHQQYQLALKMVHPFIAVTAIQVPNVPNVAFNFSDRGFLKVVRF